jgi:hypothetical protein
MLTGGRLLTNKVDKEGGTNRMRIATIILSTIGVLIIVAALFTPLEFFAPHYAIFWAIACFIIVGVLEGAKRGKQKR